MAYSLDLRKRALDFVSAGGSKAEASRRFSVGRSTLYNWLNAPDPSKRSAPVARRPRTHAPRLREHAERASSFHRITDAANKSQSAIRGIAEKASLRKATKDAKGLHGSISLVGKSLRATTGRLENVERSIKDVNDEGKGLRRYNGLLKRGTDQTKKFDTALNGVTSEIDEQIERMRRQTREQDRLNKARMKGSRIPDSAAPSPDHAWVRGHYRKGHWRRKPGTRPNETGFGRAGGRGRGSGMYGGVGGLAFAGAYGAQRGVRSAFSNAFTVNQLLTTIRAEGATNAQVAGARETILKVSGQTRFTAEDVGTYILNSMRSGFSITETTRALPDIAGLAIAEDKSLEDSGRLLSQAAQAMERPLSQMRPYTEQVSLATSMSPLRPEDIEFINQRALSTFRIAGGTETDLLAILAELRKTVSSRRLLGTALRSIPSELHGVMQGRGNRRQQEVWERLVHEEGLQTQGKDFLQVFHDIGKIALNDKSIILDLFGDVPGLRIQQLITEGKLENIMENRTKLLNAEGNVQKKVDIQKKSGMDTWMRLLSAAGTAGIALVDAMAGMEGIEMKNFNSLMESAMSLIERFTSFVNQNKDKIGKPFKDLADWVDQNKDNIKDFFGSFFSTVKPVIGLFVSMAKRVAQLIVDYPKLIGVLAASFIVWKLLGGHVRRVIFGLQSLPDLMRKGMPEGGKPIAFWAGMLAILKKVGTRVKDTIGLILKSGLGLAPLVGWIKGIAVAIGGVVATIGAPITAAIIAVAAVVIGLGALIVRNWETIKALFSSVADFFGAVFQYAAEVVKGWFYIIEPVVSPVLEGINSVFSAIWDTLKGIASWIEDKFIGILERVTGIVTSATELVQSMTGWVKEKNAPAEFRKTQKEAATYFKSEEFLNIDSKITAALDVYKTKTGKDNLSKAYTILKSEEAKIAGGETGVRTREGFEKYKSNYDLFGSEIVNSN